MMNDSNRKMGIDIIGDAPWGTHLCLFYQTKEDLIDILAPYFKAGLENNEFCMWVTSGSVSEKEAKEAMRKAAPDFDQYLKRGQIEIVPYTQWYLKDGAFNLKRVLNAWIDKLNQALSKGYDGIRVTGNTAWLEKRAWRSFTDYEEELNNTIGKYRMIAVCTYSLDRCGASEVINVVGNHESALIRREGKWEIIESTKRKRAEETEKKRVQELEAAYKELRETQAKLIQAGKMAAMGTLGAGIAHQLNQPLAGIRGFVQTILMQIDENNLFYEDLKKIEEQTGLMRDIVHNVSGFARRSVFRKEPIDINKPVDKALELLNEQLRLHGINLVKSLEPDLPMVNANFNQMQQVFINFIVNAREALDALPKDARKELTITTRTRHRKPGESWIEIEFSDTGPGVQDDIKDRIYEPFFTTKEPSSTGLGLYLNYGMIQDHGGSIELVSKEGKGATFIVKLPVFRENEGK